MKKVAEKALTSFFVCLVLILMGFISAIYLAVFLYNKQTLDEELRSRGRSIVKTIVFARKWNARSGAVYVEKKEGVTSNPFLENPDIEATDGTVYTKKNPALMVREISEIARQEANFQFHMASLKPLNPENKPDAFEEGALMAFESGIEEVFTKEHRDGSTFFRYMVPLLVEEACLECHGYQGYRIGDVRGGISVGFNIDEVEAAHARNLHVIIALALASLFSLFFIVYRLVRQLRQRLKEAEARLQQMAITDELTGLRNRRYLMERLHAELSQMRRTPRPLACIMFDLDHFKRVNDSFGHEVGDRTLREIAATIKEQCRASDILSRFGGEEFVIVLPGTSLGGAREVAERLRQAIASRQVPLADGESFTVTASFGVACLQEFTQEPAEAETTLLKKADDALYEAKTRGRNRVECSE